MTGRHEVDSVQVPHSQAAPSKADLVRPFDHALKSGLSREILRHNPTAKKRKSLLARMMVSIREIHTQKARFLVLPQVNIA